MKVTGKPKSPATFPGKSPKDVDLKPVNRRKTRNPSLTRGKRVGGQGRRSRPETPLLKWKVEDRERERERDKERSEAVDEVEEEEEEEGGKWKGSRGGRRRKGAPVVSARKLAAGLWRLQVPERGAGGGESRDQLGFQPDKVYQGLPFLHNHKDKHYGLESRDPLQSPSSVSGSKNGFLCKVQPSLQFSNSAMEGATKWAPVCMKATDEVRQIYSHMKRIDQQVSAVSIVTALEAELEMARARVEELETERRSSKKKLEHFLKKVSEERAAWRSREHEKVRIFIDDVKADLSREKKNRQRLEIVNSKLVNELAEAKLTAKRCVHEYEKERKARVLIEEVCDELANEIGEDKAEVEELKRDSFKFREEVEDERKMLQMAEVWREERVQMKLVDAKIALEEKYSQMNKLVADMENFLRSRGANPDDKDLREAELLKNGAGSVNIQDFKEFKYEPPNSDDIFSVFEDVNFAEGNEREIEPCDGYSPASHASKVHTVNPESNAMKKAYYGHNDGGEEDESGWETVSHLEDQCSSYSPEGSMASVNRNYRHSNVSGSGTEWGENGCGESPAISDVSSVAARHLKKVSAIARLWRSGTKNSENYRIISVDGANGRKSSVSTLSPDRGSCNGEWSPSKSSHPHVTRGKKGRIEWPRGAQKNSLKARLLEARIESQKVQLRHVLNQKI